MTAVKITILGCGNSAGVPQIGNYWGACDPNEPRNRRRRASVSIQSANTTLIVDTGPDFRDQINDADIRHIDAILYTHAHSDHISGIDELRVFRNRLRDRIPIMGDRATIDELHARFEYMFQDRDDGLYPAVLKSRILDDADMSQPMKIGDMTITPFVQDHGFRNSLGLRIGNVGYSTDMVDLDQQALETLYGIDAWVVDAAGYNMERNIVHATLRQVYALNEIVQAKRVYLTHMPAFMDYKTLCDELPDGYEPAYDGLVLDATV